MTGFELIVWAGREASNHRYHIRGLKKDQWNQVEVKVSQLHLGWEPTGKTFEGEVAHALRFYYDDALPDGAVLIDDVEITE